MPKSIASLPFLSDRGNETYKILLREEVDTEAIRRQLESQAFSFTRLDMIWLRRVTASIDDDMESKLTALEQMLESENDVMVQCAHAELIAIQTTEAHSILLRHNLATCV